MASILSRPLAVACACGHFHIADYLISKGADPNVPFVEDPMYPYICTSPLDYVVENGPVKAIYYLAGKHKADVNGKPLCLAVKQASYKKIKALFELKADPNITDPGRDAAYVYPVETAATSGMDGILKMLIDYGANVNLTNDHTQSALYSTSTCMQTRPSTVRILFEAGVNPDLGPSFDHPPILNFICCDKLECTKIILEYNGNPTIDLSANNTWKYICQQQNIPTEEKHEYLIGAALLRQNAGALAMLYQSGCPPNALWKDHWQERMNIFPFKLQILCKLIMTRPHSLLEISRFRVRRLIGWCFFKEKIKLLPMPKTLQEYVIDLNLCYKDHM